MQLGRISALCLSTLLLLSTVSCRSSKPKTAEQQSTSSGTLKPINVVFITLDTVRADHLHCYGYKKIQTPNIDNLAASGVLFEKAVTQTPLTCPSHASMFTGLNPNVHNVRDTGGFKLAPNFITLAAILKQHGWDTGAFLSSSVLASPFGFNQGFSVYDDQMTRLGVDEGKNVTTRPADQTADRAIDWLNHRTSQPYLMWVHFYDAHQPYRPPAEFKDRYPDDPYDAEIAFIDQQLGRVLDAVHRKSSTEKTLIVLLSDHGEGLGDHGEYNHGVFLYDPTVRITWIMSGPGVPRGVRVQQQARTIDVEPTILELLGGKASSSVQGTSVVPAFSGRPVNTTYSYEETLYPKINMHWAELRGIHTAQWMYVRAPKPELYDLAHDPGELHNVITAHPREYRDLEQQLKQLSHLGDRNTETLASSKMDAKTMEQLHSLGYVGGEEGQNIELNGEGIDPKDRTGVLKTLYMTGGAQADRLSDAQKIDLLRKGLAEYPGDPSLYYSLGDEYQKIGRPDLALESSLDALHAGVKSAMLYTRLGQLYAAKGDLPQAIESYKQVFQFDPSNVEAITGLANAYSNSGQIAEAERGFQQALVIQPYAPAYNGLALLAVRSQNFPEARKDFNRAIELDPNYADARLNLGILCMQTGDAPCARDSFNTFLAKADPVRYQSMIPKVHNALALLARER